MLPPPLVWGLVVRGLGLAYAVAFGSLAVQAVAVAGNEGISPLRRLHAAMRRDFGPLTRAWLFPSLLWLSDDDRTIRWLPWLGLAAALSVVVGGPHTPWALLGCWAIYLSFDRAVGLVYPWDSLLLEAGLWGAALPAAQLLPEFGVVSSPDPALAWLFRLLVFRVMFGFGKQKFLGSKRADAGFLHGFLIRQPLPTPLGWWSHRLPMPLLVAGLATMFAIEVVLPFAVFVPGPLSVAFAAATIGLMVAIQLTGNYGFFNLLTAALAVCLLDQQTPASLDVMELFGATWSPAVIVLHGAIVLHTVGAMILVPLNTWASFTWSTWPLWRRVRPRPLAWIVVPFRWLHPLRWLHAYGVFPPRSAPAVRMSPQLEVTWDGEAWSPVDYRWWPSRANARPAVVAPHHPRLDQAVVYEAVGFEETGPLRGLTGRWDPYGHTRISGAGEIMQAVLEGRNSVGALLSLPPEVASRGHPPVAVRVRLFMLEPTTPAERRDSGAWWRRTRVPDHYPVLRLGDPYLDTRPPPPELWCIDDLWWMERSRFGPCLRAVAGGADLHTEVLAGPPGVDATDVRRLWEELVPMLEEADIHAWTDLLDRVDEVRARWDRDTIDRLERVQRRYVVLVVAKLAPRMERAGLGPVLRVRPDPLGLRNHGHVSRLAAHLILQGRERFDAALRDDARLIEAVQEMTPSSGTYFDALWSPERIHHQVLKIQQLAAQLDVGGRPATPSAPASWVQQVTRRLWSAFDRIDLLRDLDAERLTRDAGPDLPWPRFDQSGLRFRRRD